MRALLLTNHFFAFSGSEIVILEVAEALKAQDFEVVIAAAVIGRPLAWLAMRSGLKLLDFKSPIDPTPYDLVWTQHGTLANLDMEALVMAERRPFLVSCHLSPSTALEQPLCVEEEFVCDLIVANSEETQAALAPALNREIVVFGNAAPRKFRQSAVPVKRLKRLLCVTNHLDGALYHALLHLHKNLAVHVDHIGYGGEFRRVEPEDIHRADAVISIGKTVQYALLARRAVYVYDSRGGLGWLLAENFDEARRFNFSGRPQLNRLTAEALAEDLFNNFAPAQACAAAWPETTLDALTLEPFVSDLVRRVGEPRSVLVTSRWSVRDASQARAAVLAMQEQFKARFGGSGAFATPSLSRYFEGG